MIILDTNVVSEPLKPRSSPLVEAWLNRQIPQTLYLTATSLAELLLGVALLPKGRRKQQMARAVEEAVELFPSRILPFDDRAAEAYALLVSRARASGSNIAIPDGQIAAIAQVHGYSVATRDTRPFLAAGVPVLNPWEA